MKLKIETLKQKQALLRKVDAAVNDKLTYAVKRIFSRMDEVIKKPLDEIQEAITDFSIDRASVDEKGNLMMTGDKYSFTPGAHKEIKKFAVEQSRQFDATEVDLEGYIIDPSKPGFERATVLFDEFDVEELNGILF